MYSNEINIYFCSKRFFTWNRPKVVAVTSSYTDKMGKDFNVLWYFKTKRDCELRVDFRQEELIKRCNKRECKGRKHSMDKSLGNKQKYFMLNQKETRFLSVWHLLSFPLSPPSQLIVAFCFYSLKRSGTTLCPSMQ